MSTLRTNALEGVDAKNSITIIAGAGNVTTTNMQEGLAKHWSHIVNGSSTEDSFNQGSLTDNGTGDYSWTYTNNFNNAGYAQPLGARSDNGECPAYYGAPTSSGNRSFIFLISNVSSASDNPNFTMSSHGDLA